MMGFNSLDANTFMKIEFHSLSLSFQNSNKFPLKQERKSTERDCLQHDLYDIFVYVISFHT